MNSIDVRTPLRSTLNPTSTGASVLGIVYDEGVFIAADNLVSYGSMARFRNCERILRVNDTTVAGCGGDFADFQHVRKIIEQKQIEEESYCDGFSLSPKALHSWLTRVQYNRRSKFDPFWNTWVVGGIQDGKPYLGYVDLLGLAFTEKAIATGLGNYLAKPVLFDALEKKPSLTEAEARDAIEKCMKILFCRDSRSFPKYHLAKVTAKGSTIEGPIEVKADWTIAPYVIGYE